MSEPTTAMDQYLRTKSGHADALLFFRLGDFYELFFDDAETVASELGIALTQRGTHQGKAVPMAGVPVRSVDTYLARLIRAGHKVAVCEQLESPEAARQRGSKAPIRRGVVRIITPGTLTEESLLDPRTANAVAAVGLSGRGEAALAVAEISTGRFDLRACTLEELPTQLAASSPREIVVAQTAMSHPRLGPALREVEVPLVARADVRARPAAGAEALKAVFGVADASVLGDFLPVELAACGLLLEYLGATQPGAPLRLDAPARREEGDHLIVDPPTRASLEIARSADGGKRGSLLATVDRCKTAPGGRLLAARLARPLTDIGAIERRLDAVAFLLAASDLRRAIAAELGGLPDPERAAMRLRLGRGGPRDLAALAVTLAAAGRMVARLGEEGPAELQRIGAKIDPAADPEIGALADNLGRALADELPPRARDGGFIAPGYDADLDAAREARRRIGADIAGLEAGYREETGIQAARVRHNAPLGYFVEIPARAAGSLAKKPVWAARRPCQTLANTVRFHTPELLELEARLSRSEEEGLRRETMLFDDFVGRIEKGAPTLARLCTAIAELDVAVGWAQWAHESDSVRPVLQNEPIFDIEGGRHPVVEASRRGEGEGFIANDCRLDARGGETPRLLLVTGPNMAGKSTWLRQNALLAVMAQAGGFVPARKARIGVVDRIFSRVGAADDLARGRSTFMVEMIETASILRQAGERALVILDEVGRGTATYDGLAIAWAVTEYLHDVVGCRALFSTHYRELTDLASRLEHAGNVSLRAKEWKGRLVFLHEVVDGASDRSYGVQAARLAGLPDAALVRSEEILRRLEESGGADGLSDLPLFEALPCHQRQRAEERPEADVAAALREIDADALSPREALELIYRLRALLE